MSPDRCRVLLAHAGAELYGADRILIELVRGLVDKGWSAQVVLPGPGPLHDELARLGVRSHRRNLGVLRRAYFTPLGLLDRLRRIVTAVLYLRRLIRAERIGVVHSHTSAVIAAALAARLTGRPHVWHVHEVVTRPRWFARATAWALERLAQRVVFVSEAAQEHLCGQRPSLRARSTVIHNGIDTARALAGHRGLVRAECGWSAEHLVVGMVGRVNWWKGQGRFLDAARLLAPRFPSMRFLLVGGTYGDDRQAFTDLELQVARDGLQGRVAIQDFRADVGNVLADVDIFVLPSTEPDPFPTVVLEAMAAAKPVVAFGHGGVCEMLVDGESGVLCEPCSAPALAAGIERLAAAPALRQRLGEAARRRCAECFTHEAFIDRFAGLYAGIVGAR